MVDGTVRADGGKPLDPGTYDYALHHELRLAFLELDDSLISTREIGARFDKGGLNLRDLLVQIATHPGFVDRTSN